MTTNPVYDMLVEQITDDLERKVLQALLDHASERITRYQLLEIVHGPQARQWAQENGLANSTEDRQNREIIERLQAKDYPIVSSSGQAGYILAADPETTEAYIAEIGSRIKNMEAKKDALRRSTKWIPFIRQWKDNRPLKQGRLI